jgi:hypothetical protein
MAETSTPGPAREFREDDGDFNDREDLRDFLIASGAEELRALTDLRRQVGFMIHPIFKC